MARGSIRPRQRKSGVSWEVRVDLGRDPVSGKRKQASRWFPTEREAERGLAHWLVEIARGEAPGRSRQTLADVLDYWLSVRVKDRLKPKTYADYAWLCSKHLVPGLGAQSVQRLRPDTLETFYRRLRDAGVGTRTIQLCHLCLHRALALAVEQGMVTRNAADVAKPPLHHKREMAAWTDDEAASFAAVAHQSRYGPLWLLMLATGLRRGEALGLRWSDVDVEAGTIQIRQTVQSIAGRIAPGTPKTARSRRPVDLAEPLPALLREHKARQAAQRLQLGAAWGAGNAAWAAQLVFTTPIGTPIHPDNVRHDFNRLCALAGVPRVRLHDQRHTFVTIALAAGMDVKAVSEFIGHVDVRTTMDKYQHIRPHQRRAVAHAVSRVLFPDHAPDSPAQGTS